MYDILQYSPIFKGVNPEILRGLFSKTNFYVKNFEKGESIAFRDDKYDTLMVIIKGKIKGEMQDFNGKVIKIEDLEAPQPLAPAFLFGSSNKLPVDIISESKCEVLFLPRESFMFLMQSNSIILKNYMDRICDKANFLSNRIWFLSFKTIKEKLAHYLLSLDKKKENKILINKSQTELADFFGVARPSLARVMGELEAEGIINIHGKNIEIIDRSALLELLNE